MGKTAPSPLTEALYTCLPHDIPFTPGISIPSVT